MEIIQIHVDDIIPYENNPRDNDGAVDAVAASIAEFGFKVPVVVDKDNIIVAGHTRHKAAKKLGLEFVPCIKADDLTEEQVKAFRLADNKTAELASWDFAKLEEELAGLEMDMEQFGFEDIEMPEEIEKEIEATNPVMIVLKFKNKNEMRKIEQDIRSYTDKLEGVSVIVKGGILGEE